MAVDLSKIADKLVEVAAEFDFVRRVWRAGRASEGNYGPPVGSFGVVRLWSGLWSGPMVGVQWPRNSCPGLHNLNGVISEDAGWYVPPGDLELA